MAAATSGILTLRPARHAWSSAPRSPSSRDLPFRPTSGASSFLKVEKQYSRRTSCWSKISNDDGEYEILGDKILGESQQPGESPPILFAREGRDGNRLPAPDSRIVNGNGFSRWQ